MAAQAASASASAFVFTLDCFLVSILSISFALLCSALLIDTRIWNCANTERSTCKLILSARASERASGHLYVLSPTCKPTSLKSRLDSVWQPSRFLKINKLQPSAAAHYHQKSINMEKKGCQWAAQLASWFISRRTRKKSYFSSSWVMKLLLIHAFKRFQKYFVPSHHKWSCGAFQS